MDALDKIQKEYFIHPCMRIEQSLQGMQVRVGVDDKKRVMVFGCRAGPELNITHLVHEMSHFVEADEKKMSSHAFGMKVPTSNIFGCIEFTTAKHWYRELRVAAYQYHFTNQFLKQKTTFEEVVSAFIYLPDPWLFCKSFKDDVILAKCKRVVEKYSQTYTFEKFNEEWFKRIEMVKKRFKRKVDYKTFPPA